MSVGNVEFKYIQIHLVGRENTVRAAVKELSKFFSMH